MKLCTNCMKEFSDITETCPLCGGALLDPADWEFDQPKKFRNVQTFAEAELLTELMRSNGIPCYYKAPGFGGYQEVIFGFSNSGYTVFVGESNLARAGELYDEVLSARSQLTEEELAEQALAAGCAEGDEDEPEED